MSVGVLHGFVIESSLKAYEYKSTWTSFDGVRKIGARVAPMCPRCPLEVGPQTTVDLHDRYHIMSHRYRTISSLPREILIKVLYSLDAHSLIRCKQASIVASSPFSLASL